MSAIDDRVLLLSRRWAHHANHSGYDILGRYVTHLISVQPLPSLLLPERLFWRATKRMTGYDRTGAALELRAAAHMATHRDYLYHLLYADNCFNYLGQLNGWRGHRVVASFHLPPRRLAEWLGCPIALRQLAAVILLGSTQLAFFEGFLPRERIFVVPYAVDTTFFTPPAAFAVRAENCCLFVGSHLRDLETLTAVIEDAYRLAPHLHFVVVAHPHQRAKFAAIVGNVTLYSDLSEAELLALYQMATVVIQPLQDTVANTALLEAMACGAPLVVTDIGAVRDYVTAECAALVEPYAPHAMLTAIIELVADAARRQAMAEHARTRALQFAWPCVAGQMRKTYEQIFELA